MIKNSKLNLIILFIFPMLFSCQINNISLEKMRVLNCTKDCKTYKYEQKWRKQNNPPLPPKSGVYPKLKKIFSIPYYRRMEIYPFNIYDSIYVTSPVLVESIKEPRNYLDEKYHKSLRLLSKNEKSKLSDILFNYYESNNLYGTVVRDTLGCDCIYLEYPQVILLFLKNGIFEKYIAFPDDGWNRYNFSNKEHQNFDWSEDKERMILEMFDTDILKYEDWKKSKK